MRESSRDNNNQRIEEKLNIKKQNLEPYADLKVIEDLKQAKRFSNDRKTAVINPRAGIIPADKRISPKQKVEEPKPTKQELPKRKEETKTKPSVEEKVAKEPIQPKAEVKPEPKKEPAIEKPKEPEIVLIEEQVESAVELPKMPARVKKPGVIDFKKVISSPKNVNNLDSGIRTVIAKGLADGIKVYLIELGVYDVNRGYNATKLPHEITNFIRKTNNSRFNAAYLADRLGVDLRTKHDSLEPVNSVSFKNLFEEIGEDYPKSQIIRTTEDIISKENNRFTIFEKKKMEELFEMNGIELPKEEE